MFRLFSSYRKIKALIDLANRLSDERPANTPKFGFLLTNRSFLVPLLTLIVTILLSSNIPFLLPVTEFLTRVTPEEIADHAIFIIAMITFIYSQIELAMSKGRAILTRKQAEKAVVEVVGDDKLATALKEATLLVN